MAEVLFVSKPVCPPWNDSSKNLARDLARSLQRHTAVVMTRRGRDGLSGVPRAAAVYPSARGSSFSPSLVDNAGVLAYLLLGSDADVWHFFFAPNRRSSVAAQIATSARRVPCVHTVCSLPSEIESVTRSLFADITVVLSRFAEARFLDAGVRASSLRLIPPAVAPLPSPTQADRTTLRRAHGIESSAAVWIFAGDVGPGGGALEAIDAFAASGLNDGRLLVACRDKTARSVEARTTLVERARRLGIADRVLWKGDTPKIHELLALSDLVVLPARSHAAKMDYPLVVLEAMCLERPVIVAEGAPAAELADQGGAVAVPPTADAVAAAATTLLSDSDAALALGRTARKRVLASHTPEVVGAQYETLYDELTRG